MWCSDKTLTSQEHYASQVALMLFKSQNDGSKCNILCASLNLHPSEWRIVWVFLKYFQPLVFMVSICCIFVQFYIFYNVIIFLTLSFNVNVFLTACKFPHFNCNLWLSYFGTLSLVHLLSYSPIGWFCLSACPPLALHYVFCFCSCHSLPSFFFLLVGITGP